MFDEPISAEVEAHFILSSIGSKRILQQSSLYKSETMHKFASNFLNQIEQDLECHTYKHM